MDDVLGLTVHGLETAGGVHCETIGVPAADAGVCGRWEGFRPIEGRHPDAHRRVLQPL
jgi:hypothetical protein